MRVLHIQRAKGVSGSERHLLTLLPALGALGVETRMCVLETGDGDRFVRDLRRADVDVTVQDAGGDINLRLIPALVNEIRRYRPDVVHTHLVHADVAGQLAARSLRVPAVSSVHATPEFWRREPYRTTGRIVGHLARRRIAISEHVARFLREVRLSPPERIRVVHYGIDAEGWARHAPVRAEARTTFGVSEGEIVIGVAARLIEGKGHPTLLRAVGRAVTDDGVPFTLLIAGDGSERDQLEALAREVCPPDRVRFLGFIDDVPGFLAACDLVAFPTDGHGEGFGLTALEAMAAGRPVVASDFASLPEVVEDGRTGLLVPPSSVDALRRALVQLGLDAGAREEMGIRGAARARDVFGLDKMASCTLDVYEEVT